MKILNFVSVGLIVALVSLCFAQEPEEGGTETTLATTLAAERAKKRNYPGGHDDQDLTVQANLPQPVRAPEAQSQTQTSAPADDTTHD